MAGVAGVVAAGAFGGSGGSDKVSGARTNAGELLGRTPRSSLPGISKAAVAAYGTLPLSFVPNAGQFDRRVRYSAQAAGAGFFFTRKEAVFSLAQRNKPNVALRLRFLGANRNVAIRGERPAPGRVNYLLGNDPSKWHTGLRTYERVVYRDLWPGVDMALRRARSGKLKYEFLVRPGARVRDIRLAYRGAKRLSLDRRGTCASAQRSASSATTRPIELPAHRTGGECPSASSFALSRRGGGYGFSLGRGYDRRYPLVIDPVFVYSTYLGGSEDGLWHRGGRAGNAYVTATRPRPTSPRPPGAFDETSGGGRRLRDEAQPGGSAPRLLHLPGRTAATSATASRWTARQRLRDRADQLDRLPDDPGRLHRPTTAAATTPS